MKDKALLFTGIIAAGTWAAVFCAFLIVWLQNRAAKRLTCLQLFIQVTSQYDSADMLDVRRRLAVKLLAEPTAVDLDDTLMVFYENLAILARRRLLDPELVWNTFIFDVDHYWAALRHYIEHVRKQFGDPTLYEEFERLRADLGRSNRSPLGTGRLTPQITDERTQRFLEFESRRGTPS